MIDFEEEEVDLSTLTSYAEKAQELQAAVDELESELKAVRRELESYLSDKIPSAMSSIGMKTFTLSNGKKISVRDIVSGSIEKSPNRTFAYNWTIDNGGEDLIKTNVSIDFSCKEHNYANNFIEECRSKYDLEPNVKETIHPQTFCSFVREKIEEREKKIDNGEYVEEIPYEDLGIYKGRKAVFK